MNRAFRVGKCVEGCNICRAPKESGENANETKRTPAPLVGEDKPHQP